MIIESKSKATIHKLLSLLFLSILTISCKKEFSKSEPFSLDIVEVRSYHQANLIAKRLKSAGIEAQVVALDKGDAVWYHVITQPQKNETATESDRSKIYSRYPSLKPVLIRYDSLAAQLVPSASKGESEEVRIKANPPILPPDVVETIRQTPHLPDFELIRMNVFATQPPPSDQLGERRLIGTNDITVDLPRGITRQILGGISRSFTEALLYDQLYQDRITLHVCLIDNFVQDKPGIAKLFANRILSTGFYTDIINQEIAIQGVMDWKGQHVAFKSSSTTKRSYLILMNSNMRWIILVQTTRNDDIDMIELVKKIGSTGLGALGYSEFYNSFMTLPDRNPGDDEFLGLSFSKLDWRYAQSKGYAKWAKAYTGHWSSNAYYWNKSKGIWSFGIFDLVNHKRNWQIQNMYANFLGRRSGHREINVYGTRGFMIPQTSYYNHNYNIPLEVNFIKGRYACMVNNRGSSRLDDKDLLARAQRLQLHMPGGYIN